MINARVLTPQHVMYKYHTSGQKLYETECHGYREKAFYLNYSRQFRDFGPIGCLVAGCSFAQSSLKGTDISIFMESASAHIEYMCALKRHNQKYEMCALMVCL